MMEYLHTQRGWFHYLFYIVAVIMFSVWWLDPRASVAIPIVVGTVVLVFALSFQTLTVEDQGHQLAIRFGPVPLMSKRIPYGSIQNIEVGRSSFLDGWGIHWVPGRGWTYNLWGFDCVKLAVNHKTIRIGTDDAENLAAFLRRKTASRRP